MYIIIYAYAITRVTFYAIAMPLSNMYSTYRSHFNASILVNKDLSLLAINIAK
jgi:hypothetical protein